MLNLLIRIYQLGHLIRGEESLFFVCLDERDLKNSFKGCKLWQGKLFLGRDPMDTILK